MGKRSDFKRIDKDAYQSIDPRCMVGMERWFGGVRFVEPCRGDGYLIKHLESIGASCVFSSDSEFDARSYRYIDYLSFDCFITNPPWSRNLLHPIIENLSNQAPTWLLFDSDWAHTDQANDLLSRCTDIVSIGRLIWIPGTRMAGKDNVSWYRFWRKPEHSTIFHKRSEAA